MSEPKYAVGDDLFVRDPSSFIKGATCIVGRVQAVSRFGGSWSYTIFAFVGRMGAKTEPGGHPRQFLERDLGLRLGTPISQISGRPGHDGYGEFKRIAASWGYE